MNENTASAAGEFGSNAASDIIWRTAHDLLGFGRESFSLARTGEALKTFKRSWPEELVSEALLIP